MSRLTQSEAMSRLIQSEAMSRLIQSEAMSRLIQSDTSYQRIFGLMQAISEYLVSCKISAKALYQSIKLLKAKQIRTITDAMFRLIQSDVMSRLIQSDAMSRLIQSHASYQ